MKKAVYPKIINDFYPEATFDYHNLGVLSLYEIEDYFLNFIDECNAMHYKRVLIITGKGLVVRPHIQRLLKQSKLVESFRTANYFNGQNGAFEVILK